MTGNENIAENGFRLLGQADKLGGLALISLKIALKAYFSTYHAMEYTLHMLDPENKIDQGRRDGSHTPAYFEAYTEAVVHFQHFVELVFKDILRDDHRLLADDPSNYDVIFHMLLKGETISEADYETLKSIEFKDALERICNLINAGRIGNGALGFICEAKTWLEKLNKLRNRVWHRGTFILRYPSLDVFVGRSMLPFVNKIIVLPKYADLHRYWKYGDLKCGIDPIQNIINVFEREVYDLGKIAFLKELGRAAFANPLRGDTWSEFFNREYRRRAERIAESEKTEPNVAGVRECPVCGLNSLIVYDDVMVEGEDPYETELDEEEEFEGKTERAWHYTFMVKCVCCTFEINHYVKNPTSYGFPIEDYWVSEQISHQ